MKGLMNDQLNSLEADQKNNLDFLVDQALDPLGVHLFDIPRNSVMSDNDFPQFMTWYMEQQGLDGYPVFDMRDKDTIKLSFLYY